MAPSSYLWSEPDQPIAVDLSVDVVQRLGLEALEAFKAVPRRGLEIGGILLGRASTEDGTATIHIEGYQRVESEHRSGPSFRLSESDIERLDQLRARHPNIAGVYRTHTRSESIALEDDDLRLFERCCTRPDQVFLVIQPATATAVFFLPRDGRLMPVHEFPFRAGELIADGPAEETVEAAAGPVLDPAPQIPDPRPAPPEGDRDRKLAWVTPAAALLLGFTLGAALWLQFHQRRADPPAAVPSGRGTLSSGPGAAPSGPSAVALNVKREGRSLHLFWDRQSAIIRQASRATLYIQDGAHDSRLELAPRELSVGTLSYWPETQDIGFRLEVRSAGGAAEGAIRVVGGVGIPQPDPAAPAAKAIRPEPVPPPPPVAQPVPSPAPGIGNQEPREMPRSELARPAPAETKPSPFPSSAPAAVEPRAPEPAAPLRAAEVRSVPVAGREPEPKSYVSVSAEPVSSSFLGRVAHRIPLISRFRKHPQTLVPPKPVREVRPVLTPQERRSLTGEVPVHVKVYVTEAGKVDYAELLSRASDSNRALAAAAVYAARRWTFTPARLGEEAVSGEVVLHFAFRPER